jgi:biotin carboxylase
MESGVELADTLSEQLKLPSNGTKLSRARRDKYEMVEVLGRENIPHVKHFKSNSLIEALEWVATVNKYPIVVKPIDSARTEGVKVCYSDKEIIDAFNLILGSTNFMGFPNNEVLLQTYLNGIEYMIDGVSVNGNHRITEIWRSTKKYQGGAYIYDLEELITYEGLEQSIIIPYVYNVLDALGIKFGPTHTEVMLTSDGPILIESGARLHGSIDPNAITDCMNTNHVELTVDSYIDPDNFQKQINSPYELYKHCFCIALISESSGVIKSIPAINKIKSLPSYFSHMIDLKVGDYVKKTVDIVDCPGIIYLTHENRSVLKKDYQEIRRLEKSEFYDFI